MTSSNNRVFIRNLPHEITEKELLNEFKRFGSISDSSLKADRGIAFLTFHDSTSYKNCLENDNKLKIQGRIIGIHEALPAQYEETSNSSEILNSKENLGDYDTIYVGNINNNVEDYEVREAFMKYKPHEVKLVDSDDHKMQYAYIKILYPDLIDKALHDMNGYNLKGSKITVDIADYSLY